MTVTAHIPDSSADVVYFTVHCPSGVASCVRLTSEAGYTYELRGAPMFAWLRGLLQPSRQLTVPLHCRQISLEYDRSDGPSQNKIAKP